MDQLWLWIGFNLFVLAMLALDLGVFHRKAHGVTMREAVKYLPAADRERLMTAYREGRSAR